MNRTEDPQLARASHGRGLPQEPPPPAVPNFPHLQFAAIAARHPGAPAIVHESGTLSYGELEARANRLAHQLQTLGIGPHQIVALRLPRSVELVVAVLGVYKAGGGFLLLENSAPMVRIQSILEQVRPALMIGTGVEATSGNLPCQRRDIAALERDAAVQSAQAPKGVPSPDHIATVFMTSGSTGTPKAVLAPYGLHVPPTPVAVSSERHVLKTDSGTTFTRGEILRPLQNGQSLHLAPEGIERDLRTLAGYLADQGITHLIATPSALQALLDLDDPRWTHTLRNVLCSGERLTPRLKRTFLERTQATLTIAYGCTEVPTATVRQFRSGDDPDDPSVGMPVPHMEVHVLDEERRPLGAGETGEIFLGGLMPRRYLNDPEQTAKRFIPHPFRNTPGAGLFRTGDRGRWLPGGGLEVLGRVDDQVKIRGFRVEIGEVEALLSSHPQIAACAVVPREHPVEGTSLIAYVVPHAGAVLTESGVTAFVRSRGPMELVPSRIRLLNHLPLTAAGKLDRRALPDPDSIPTTRQDHVPPRDPVESHLVAIWESVLGRFPIGVRDDFFDLGGHSLQVVRMLDQIEQFFRQRPPLDALWSGDGTIESLARFLRGNHDPGPHPELIQLRGGNRTPLFVTDVISGAGLVHYYQLLRGFHPDQPVHGLLAPGTFGRDPLAETIPAIAAHCIASLRVVQPRGPYRLAGYSSGGLVAYEMAVQLRGAGEEVSRLVLLDTSLPRVFSPGSLLKGIATRLRGHPAGLHALFRCGLLTLKRRWGSRDFRTMADAHLWAQFHYRPAPYPGPVDLILARDARRRPARPLNGWSPVLTGTVAVREVPGDHMGMVTPPLAATVGGLVQGLLDA
ncbi:MAG: hypothetical protein RIS76_790 [Verrucomicrobiota bacterium]